MTEFHSLHGPCPPIPDNLTVPQFLLDSTHPSRAIRNDGSPWLIEDATGKAYGYEEVRMRTFGLANALKKRWNVVEDDVVAIFSPNDVDYPIAIWAVHRLGAVVTTANPNYMSDELVHQLTLTKARLIICSPDAVGTALDAARKTNISPDQIILMRRPPPSQSSGSLPYPAVDDLITEGLSSLPLFTERTLRNGEGKTKLAFLSFSSGTTGKPKAVVIPHYAVIANVIQKAKLNGINSDYAPKEEQRYRVGDVAAAVLPFFQDIYGLIVNLHFVIFSGLSLVVISKFNFENYLKTIDRYKITHLLVVPPHIVLFCKHPATKKYDLSHVRLCLCGAAPLSAELTQQLVKILPNASIGQGYGMTETCTTLTMIPATQHMGAPGSAGQLAPGIVARVLKEDGTFANVGEIGELIVKGPQMALRYLYNEKATRETFQDGWVRTGDEVYFDKDGELFVVDRLKEILKVRGFQVAPAELEGHLLGHPAVADACVVGIPDSYSGEIPLAFVVLDSEFAEQVQKDPQEGETIKASLVKHVSDAKVQYKWLAGGVEFVDVIPKNPSGKLLRRVMRDKARELRLRQINAKL